mgnify:CR=1 FL=1
MFHQGKPYVLLYSVIRRVLLPYTWMITSLLAPAPSENMMLL